MNKLFSIILIGALSLLFAEVFSGSSQQWFLNPVFIFLLFSVYLGHLLFFLWLAFNLWRTSLTSLYFFGVIFGLYESWITKVLWAGYQGSEGPMWGTLLGVGLGEVPILVFFWHPIMAFIVPVLTFEILTGKVLASHKGIILRTRGKGFVIAVIVVLMSTFLAKGNRFDILSSNLSLLGTMLISYILFLACRKSDLRDLVLGRIGFAALSVYLAAFYVLSFLFWSPEDMPKTLTPYIPIIALYALAILILRRLPKSAPAMEDASSGSYSKKDIVRYSLLAIASANISCLLPTVAYPILVVSYLLFTVAGAVAFLSALRRAVTAKQAPESQE